MAARALGMAVPGDPPADAAPPPAAGPAPDQPGDLPATAPAATGLPEAWAESIGLPGSEAKSPADRGYVTKSEAVGMARAGAAEREADGNRPVQLTDTSGLVFAEPKQGQGPAGQAAPAQVLQMPAVKGGASIRAQSQPVKEKAYELEQERMSALEQQGVQAAELESLADDAYKIERAKAAEQAGIERAALASQAQALEEQQQIRERVSAEVERQEAEVDRLIDETSSGVDLSEQWGAGRKVGAAIAIAMAGIGDVIARRDRPNPVVGIIERAINRDIAVQRANIASKQSSAGMRQNLISRLMDRGMSEVQASRWAMLKGYELAQREIALKGKEFGLQSMPIELRQAQIAIQQKAQDHRLKIREGSLSSALQESALRLRTEAAATQADQRRAQVVGHYKAMAEKMRQKANASDGAPTGTFVKDPAKANRADNYKLMRDALIGYADMMVPLTRIKNLVKKYSGGQYATEIFWSSDTGLRIKGNMKDLLLKLKKSAQLGVLSKSDEGLLNAWMGEADSPRAVITGTVPQLEEIENNARRQVENKAKIMGYGMRWEDLYPAPRSEAAPSAGGL